MGDAIKVSKTNITRANLEDMLSSLTEMINDFDVIVKYICIVHNVTLDDIKKIVESGRV